MARGMRGGTRGGSQEGGPKFLARTRTKFPTETPSAVVLDPLSPPPLHPCEVYTPADARTTSSPWKLWRKPNSKCTFAHHLEPTCEFAAATAKSHRLSWTNVPAKQRKLRRKRYESIFDNRLKKKYVPANTMHVRLCYYTARKLREWLITLSYIILYCKILSLQLTNVENCSSYFLNITWKERQYADY